MQKRLENHLVVCGLGHVGYRIVELLHQLGETVVVLTRDIRPEWKPIVQKRAARYIEGDARSEACLRSADVATARAVIIVTDNDLINIEIALDVQRICPNLPLIVRIFDRFLADRAQREMRVRNVLSPGLLTAPVFVAAAQGEEMLRAFEIADNRLNVVQIRFEPASSALEQEAASFCREHDLLPLCLHRSGTGHEGSASSLPLAAGDILVAMASGKATERLRKEGFLPRRETLAQRNHPWRRLLNFLTHPLYPLQAIARVWRRAPAMLRMAFVALHLLFLLTVVVFHIWLPSARRWEDAVFFTVTIMTTVGFSDYNLGQAHWWLKLYACVVMIAGAGLVAIAFGLITDYIVSARVDQALGRRKTRLEDHIIVIGLGDVGTRIVEELYRIGEPVVALERDADHEAVPALQDHIHVIIGDANRESAMLQAGVEKSRAVIVTTTSDIDSLRIAHQAETFNPNLRTVIRIYDSELAHKLGLGLGLDRTVNAAQTAAATFVACALQTGVEQSFMLGNRLFALRWRSEEEGSANCPEWTVLSKSDASGREKSRAAKRKVPFAHRERTGKSPQGALVIQEYDARSRVWHAPAFLVTEPPS